MEVQKRMFTYERAAVMAKRVYDQLFPYCDVIGIAGSIRRRKPEVKDIEIVCIPKKVKVGSVDLFGGDNRKEVIHDDYIRVINSLGKTLKGSPHGRMMQIELPEGIILDLFMPEPYDFWRQFAIRTGSAEYSQKKIAGGWVKKGWCGTSNGLRMQSECNSTDIGTGGLVKLKWTLKPEVKEPTLPPVWENEKQFFDWLGVQYLAPENRNL